MKLGVYIALTIITHIIWSLSVFDIYFTSPVIRAKDYQPEIFAPASRLVLFVADGLRADTFFSLDSSQKTSSPYLRNILLKDGMWGISRTKPPTESRPCHVAMTSGFYEDSSAIYKGWKKNPVEFDNIFNKSRYTWAFGSYEVIPIFARGDTLSHYVMHTYYGDNDDSWVFDSFVSFLLNAQPNSHLYDLLHQEKIVFFLHLVATDTYGHKFGASSNRYSSNLKKIDAGISQVVSLLDSFYNKDGRTAYMLVSDHGMTDKGSHGSGSRAETESPLLVWGSGVRKQKVNASNLSDAELQRTRSWKLDPSSRLDVHQVDLAPLMASLIGVPVPANSMGMLPVQYLSVNDRTKASLLFSNARQSCELYKVQLEKASSQSLIVFPFMKLTLREADACLKNINRSVKAGKFAEAQIESERLIRLAQEGAHFYYTHHRFSLIFMIILGFLSWILVCGIILFQSTRISQKVASLEMMKSKRMRALVLLVPSLLVIFSFTLLQLPIAYYFYYILPLFIIYYIVDTANVLQTGIRIFANVNIPIYILSFLAFGLLIMSFLHRQALALFLLSLSLAGFVSAVPYKTKIFWCTTCAVASIFPFLPVVKSQLMVEAVLFAVLMVMVFFSIFTHYLKASKKYAAVFVLPLLSGLIVYVVRLYSGRQFFLASVLSWTILVLSWIIPLFTPTQLLPRAVCLFTCHASTYFLLSLSYDALFFIVFCFLLAAWVIYEVQQDQQQEATLMEVDFASVRLNFDSESKFSPRVFCRSFMLDFLLLFALFGLENTETLTHFDTRIMFTPFAVPGFSAVFKSILFYYKIILPYVMIVLSVLCIAVATNTNLKQLLCCSIAIGDAMAICFLFLVQDSGSWLVMGNSIAHYVISMFLPMSLAVLYFLGKFLLTVKIC